MRRSQHSSFVACCVSFVAFDEGVSIGSHPKGNALEDLSIGKGTDSLLWMVGEHLGKRTFRYPRDELRLVDHGYRIRPGSFSDVLFDFVTMLEFRVELFLKMIGFQMIDALPGHQLNFGFQRIAVCRSSDSCHLCGLDDIGVLYFIDLASGDIDLVSKGDP